ncbi:MAG: hypothetical protein LRY50_06100 [Geovibrio sp.]|nr:hypothetical protein [Geovibrio sp.]
MTTSALLIITYIILLILVLVVAALAAKVRRLEKKLIEVTPSDLYPFIEELRELVIESERIATKLENSIRERESVLEDLTVLADSKLADYGRAAEKAKPEKTLKEKIRELAEDGMPDSEIARKLGISTTEVKIVRSMGA